MLDVLKSALLGLAAGWFALVALGGLGLAALWVRDTLAPARANDPPLPEGANEAGVDPSPDPWAPPRRENSIGA